MRKRGFVEKFLNSIVAYIHKNIPPPPKKNPQIFLLMCTQSLEFVVSIGREFVANPVHLDEIQNQFVLKAKYCLQ